MLPKFFIAKKDGLKCHHCQTYLSRGNDVASAFIRGQGRPVVLLFHPICYMLWYETKFQIKWRAWKTGEGNNPPPVKLGRPVEDVHADYKKQLHRLMACRSHHKKMGNQKKVELFDYRIKMLKKEHELKQTKIVTEYQATVNLGELLQQDMIDRQAAQDMFSETLGQN